MKPESEGEQQPIINIVGEKVALGPLRRNFVPLYLRWINDFDVTRFLGIGMRPRTVESEEAWYERTAKNEGIAIFTIYERSTMSPIGVTNLGSIDFANRNAMFDIMIGEKTRWGKGYGTETARLMLDYGFNGLGLHNIMLVTYSFNTRAIRAYTKAGFKEFGRQREAIWRGGRPYDVVYMDCLSTEFEGSVLRRLLADQ